MQQEADTDTVQRLPLKALGLRSGMALQTRRLVEGTSKTEAQFFGAIEGKGVMVGPANTDAEQTGLTPGEVCIVRGFTGQFEFSFLSKVLQTFEKPFAYALLAYPAQVDAKQVRQSLRTKVAWPAAVRVGGQSAFQSVTLVDLSLHGAMVRSHTALGSVGDAITLQLDGNMDTAPITVQIQAQLCHHSRPIGQDVFIAGMAFKEVSAEDKLKLHYLTATPLAESMS